MARLLIWLLLAAAPLRAAALTAASDSTLTVPTDSAAIAASLSQMLALYPEARLADIYKSCFQNIFGPGHLAVDPAMAREAIDEELAAMAGEEPNHCPTYEYTLPDGAYVRLNLTAVADGRVPYGTFFDAFIESVDVPGRPTIGFWRQRWDEILAVAISMGLDTLQGFEADRAAIAGMLAAGQYVAHHSPRFEETYHPHYRIIRRDIFDSRILPLLMGSRRQ